ncbi:MAG: hypothetical protein ACAI37_25510 [Chthoniobacter sp.]
MQTPEYKPLTIGDWIVTKIILLIPFVGLIMLFVWAFSSDTHPSKKTFCQSSLILAGCIIALMLVLVVVMGGFAAVMGHTMQQQLSTPPPQ